MMEGRLTLRRRASGLLLHPTSLPGPHGVGDLGPSAHRFVDFLAASGQGWWQMLPVGPPGPGHSPYSSPSAFAGSPLLISLEGLVEEGLLEKGEVRPPPGLSPHRVEYGAVARFKGPLLRRAFRAFESGRGREEEASFEAFRAANESWLPDYSLFCALEGHFRGAPWPRWESPLRSREPAALARAREDLAGGVRFCEFLQYAFFRQWSALRRRCRERGVGLIGDIPLYVSWESADVWANQGVFRLDSRGRPTAVAGVPPDYFSRTGQLWGNPLYRWDALRGRGYDWWVARLRATFEKFDAARLDHFIGFHRYWEVPAGERTAMRGRWAAGPGGDFFSRALRVLGPLELIAEDLGILTPEAEALRDRFGFPGIRVLQFAFGEGAGALYHRPHSFPRRCVVYTGTHDNDTIVGWFADRGAGSSTRSKEEIGKERAFALRYLGSDGQEIHWDMIRLALSSVADLAIIPLQDVLGLGSQARMNRPGSRRGNWRWRLGEGELKREHGDRLRLLCETYSRAASGRRRGDVSLSS